MQSIKRTFCSTSSTSTRKWKQKEETEEGAANNKNLNVDFQNDAKWQAMDSLFLGIQFRLKTFSSFQWNGRRKLFSAPTKSILNILLGICIILKRNLIFISSSSSSSLHVRNMIHRKYKKRQKKNTFHSEMWRRRKSMNVTSHYFFFVLFRYFLSFIYSFIHSSIFHFINLAKLNLIGKFKISSFLHHFISFTNTNVIFFIINFMITFLTRRWSIY